MAVCFELSGIKTRYLCIFTIYYWFRAQVQAPTTSSVDEQGEPLSDGGLPHPVHFREMIDRRPPASCMVEHLREGYDLDGKEVLL